MSPRAQAACLILVTAVLTAEHRVAATPPSRSSRAGPIAVAPVFVENTGQADPLARFYSVGGGRPIFFTTNDVRIADPARQRSLWMTFVNGGARDIDGEWTTGGRVTVLRRATATESPMFRDVVYRSVWPGIDARVSAAAAGLKYSFEVAPGANPRDIHLRYSGHDRITLTDAGELNIESGGTTITDTRPVAYQRVSGRMVQVPVRFVQLEADVSFSLGNYDRSQPLVIDPTLVYSTYLGGTGDDEARAIAVDASGAAYVAGSARYGDFPVTSGAYQPSFRGGDSNPASDVFVAKINAAGTHFDYVTFLGGSGNDDAYGIAVDSTGNAYVTGVTRSTDFPTTAGAYRTSNTFVGDGFVSKLNSTGSALVYSTYLGGNSATIAHSIAVDSGGNAYVAGSTSATNLFVSPGAGSSSRNGGSDAFVQKLNASGTPVFGAYAGGYGDDVAKSIAVDNSGHAFITGWTNSTFWVAGSSGYTSNIYKQFPTGPIYRSPDGGQSFVSINNYPITRGASAFAIDPTDSMTAYMATTDWGLQKTTDGGAHWAQKNGGAFTGATVPYDVAVHPLSPSLVLAGTSDGMLKSFDGGTSWSYVTGGGIHPRFAPSNPSIVYAVYPNVIKSTDAGTHWTYLPAPAGYAHTLAIDPVNPNVVYVGTSEGLIKTTDGGTTWTPLSLPGASPSAVVAIAVDPTLTSVVFAGKGTGEIFRSTNGGASWTLMSLTVYPAQMTFDGGTLYIAGDDVFLGTSRAGGLSKTTDRGATWTPVPILGNTVPMRTVAALNGVIYAGGNIRYEAFVQEWDTNGTTQALMWGTYLGGALDDFGVGIALDGSQRAVVTVETHSADYPTTLSVSRRTSALTRFAFDGGTLMASSFVGPTTGIPKGGVVDAAYYAYVTGTITSGADTGVWIDRIDQSGNDDASFTLNGMQSNVDNSMDAPAGIAAGPALGDVFVTGSTNSVDFPTTNNAPQRFYGSGRSDAFASKVAFANSVPPPPPPPPPAGTNLALNKPAVASSVFSNGYVATSAVDGSLGTRWSSQFSDPQWIYVDLQGTYDISEVLLRWEIAYGVDYQIQISTDAANWTTIRTVTGGDGGVDDLTGLSGTARYVRMNGIHRGTQYGYSLWELEVYGTAAAPPPPPPPPSSNIALNRPVVSSSDFSSAYAARLAVDGDGSTRWSSQFSDPQWIYVDLGLQYDINEIRLTWETAAAADFQIQVSADAIQWTTHATITGNTHLTNTIDISAIGRYVRMYGGRRATQWGYSLWSFEVYGTMVSSTVDRARNRPVVSSSDFSPAYAAAFAVDGDSSTRWSSQFSDPQWIYVDLGQRIRVDEIQLSWETAYGADYQIQVSDDAVNWTTVAIITNGLAGVRDYGGLGGVGRYVRLYGTRRATEWGYSLWYLQVYSHPGP